MKRIILFLIVLSGVTGLLANWFIQVPNLTEQSPEAISWQPLTLPKPKDAHQLVKQLRRLKPWEQAEQITFTKSTSKSRSSKKSKQIYLDFVAIVQRGHQRYILLLDKDNKVTSYQINSQLPNGAHLHAIYNDKIEIATEGEIETINLYESN